MKSRLFLSVPTMNTLPMEIARRSAVILSSYRLVTNVTPMWSSVHVKRGNMNRVEPGCRIDILSDVDPKVVLVIWERLREVLGVHCVWLDYKQTPAGANGPDYLYSGCICEWPKYRQHPDQIGHDHALTCSEYGDTPEDFVDVESLISASVQVDGQGHLYIHDKPVDIEQDQFNHVKEANPPA